MSALHPVVVRDLSVSFRDRAALTGVDLVAQPGRRIGLVGENGAGKSTLLRAVAGRLPDSARVAGTVEAPAGTSCCSVRSRRSATTAPIGEVLAATLRPLRDAVRRVEELAGHLARRGRARRRTPRRWSTPSTTTPGTPTGARRSPPTSSDSARSTRPARSARSRAGSAPGSRWRP